MKSEKVVNYCKIDNPYRKGYKWPTLSELYRILYNSEYENAHNALSDVMATYFCMKKLFFPYKSI